MYLDKVGSIERLIQTQGDSDKEEYGPITGLSGFSINVQPASAETVALAGGIFGKTYTVFCTVSGIRDGDRLTVSGTWVDGLTLNKKVQVMNVGNWNWGPLPHFEITCAEIEQ